MSMLRFVLRKINVMHNSLIKFWSVRKSNESASLFQNIAQTKAKLQLDEAGRISTISFGLISFFVGLPLIFWFFRCQVNYSLLGSVLWSILFSVILLLIACYLYSEY